MQYSEHQPTVSNSLDSLSEFIKKESSDRRGRSIPPLDKWNPEREADMDMVIKANGEWWHEGSKVTRQSLVDLFSTVLWREGTDNEPQYFLKTPVEKLRIRVEDVPFLMTEVNIIKNQGAQQIEFISSTGDVVYLDDEHPLEMRDYQGEQRPYIEVRFGMLGLISRNVLMHLIKLGDLTEDGDNTTLTLHSGGKAYSVTVAN
ncbi:DUF1285 domain-containing protein [Psychrobacter sp.]|uniref:DUF1285 domain-containing protein n=1 Tax=Psychrobacter sp. TaxID=56811 RepID=UPI0025D498C5|nr:DUF1285 domain-containing protein [Psychrobacter sp.]